MGSDGMDIGFLGLGIMGIAMARNLLKKGFNVTVWNRSPGKCEELAKEGASIGSSPADVVKKCSITIAMLADPSVAISVALGPGGVVEGITPGKGYVDMSTVDSATSSQIAKAIEAKGGDFLEAPVSGSKQPAEAGTLIILAAGSESLFAKVKPAFDAMGKKSFFLNDVGSGAKMKLVVNMIMGSMMTAFSEGLALADKAGLSQQTLLEVLELGAIGNPMFKLKGPSMISGKCPTAFPLKHQQKDMRLALALGDEVGQSMPVAAAANEIYKKARSLGLGEQDFSSVHQALTQEAANASDSAKAAA
ncbi:glyoxylate/succinic semialdehyde reductase 1 [Physcomitrium patens]|uniref:Uncharacterized protein n=1 Tax=Physcomitrium patens TaxID=3218 RepID=A9U1X9_PHYPA|nr:glyoxylate/succinic semialdehyde reductase 1-like [Physcomitrium patens]PNR29308.1 hypothetical protein PHYPA_028000 [Physcomitrium patens]|eukprot:XP_024361826.1 glyoxylate/succinic semialdehyde reductase 1-like [Physcomitrella patens]